MRVVRATQVAIVALAVLLSAGGAIAETPRASSIGIISIEQSSHVTEQGNLTVYLEVTSTSSVKFAYFTFCQMVAPYTCYLPIAMTAHNATWFVGMTKPMASYAGMTTGTIGGYNMTVEFTNGTNVTEPTGPTSFPGLTVIQSVAGYYEYQMTVVPPTYGLTGVVSESVSGAGIAGARVSLTPSNNTVEVATSTSSGDYGFTSLPNGTYTLSASATGYQTVSQTVKISGADLVKNIQLANAFTPPTHTTTSNGGIGGFLMSPLGLGTLGAIAAIVIVGALIAFSKGKKRAGPSSPASPASTPDSSGTAVQGPK